MLLKISKLVRQNAVLPETDLQLFLFRGPNKLGLTMPEDVPEETRLAGEHTGETETQQTRTSNTQHFTGQHSVSGQTN